VGVEDVFNALLSVDVRHVTNSAAWLGSIVDKELKVGTQVGELDYADIVSLGTTKRILEDHSSEEWTGTISTSHTGEEVIFDFCLGEILFCFGFELLLLSSLSFFLFFS
jgi:hypothetical protein